MADFLNFETFKRSRRPNNYLTAPEGLCRNSRVDEFAPQFEEAPESIFQRLLDSIATERLWKNVVSDADQLRIKFIALTPLMRFKDDINIAVLADPTSSAEKPLSTLAAYSRSRIGHSDLGANRKRVIDLLHKLTAN